MSRPKSNELNLLVCIKEELACDRDGYIYSSWKACMKAMVRCSVVGDDRLEAWWWEGFGSWNLFEMKSEQTSFCDDALEPILSRRN